MFRILGLLFASFTKRVSIYNYTNLMVDYIERIWNYVTSISYLGCQTIVLKVFRMMIVLELSSHRAEPQRDPYSNPRNTFLSA